MDLLKTLKLHKDEFGLVISIDYRVKPVFVMDFSSNNTDLKNVDLSDVHQFDSYVERQLKKSRSTVGTGRYCEDRCVYDHSPLFSGKERRTIHLGIDLWVKAGTAVLAPLDSKVHSFNNNKGDGDYGPTIILEHKLDGTTFYTLYGHLSADSINGLKKNQIFKKGQVIAHVGNFPTNGNWPPHLHFQIIKDMLGKEGDYPGVSSSSDIKKFRELCPDPNLILQIPNLHLS